MDVVNRGLGSIQFLTGPLAGSTFQITQPVVSIGRDPSNTIVISDPGVSRHHARLTNNGGQWSIEKLSLQNTVTVNSRDTQQAMLHDRDTIGLGAGTSFLFFANPGVQASILSPNQQRPSPANNPQYTQPPQPALQTSGPHPAMMAPPPPPVQSQFGQTGTERAVIDGGGRGGTLNVRGAPSLEISTNVSRDKEVYPLNKQVINIGRHPSNDIVIQETIVSAFHVQIKREGNQLVLIHPSPANPDRARTLNGLLYKGRHVLGDEQFRKPLARGDFFRIGDEHGTLVTLTFNDGSGAVQDIQPEVHPIPLGAALITIGRAPDNTVVLNHPQVSAHHARLEQLPAGQGGYRIIDMGSTNGTYVSAPNEQPTRTGSRVLTIGDEVRIGPFKFIYTGTQLTQHDESSSIRIDALHLKKVGNKQTILINDISIAIPPRKFVALVGGSGAGKSTLMDALNGLRPAQEGTVLYNGQDYYSHLAAFSTQLGYVPQEDIIHRDLTVERALYYAAKLRLPSDFTEAQIKQRIDEVLEDVEMKHRRKLLVSKLSGGQRKRVSIALELLANPSVFFLDEPTSGLDPGLDRKMMFLLRKLADKGHTIVLVTHATNNINACDYVCFLAQGGRLAYYGPPNDAKTFFGKADFAEIYSALEPTDENPDTPAEAETQFKASPDYQKYVVQPLNAGPAGRTSALQPTTQIKLPKRGNPWKQFALLSMRYVELLKNDVGNLLILLLQAPIIGLILMFIAAPNVFASTNIATCQPVVIAQHTTTPVPVTTGNKSDCQNVLNFLTGDPQGQAIAANNGGAEKVLQNSIQPVSGGDAQKILFIMSFAAVMFGSINAAREIVKEAPIYRRERTVNLGIMPYMFSKIVVLGALCLLQSLVLVIMVNMRAPFHQGVFLPVFLEVYITMALTALAGLMVGLAISAIAPNNDRAMSFIPIILIPQVIFSGIIFALNDLGTQLLGSIFAVRWSMSALGSSIGLHANKLGAENDPLSYQGTLFSTYSQGGAIAHLLLMWFFLILMIVLLGCATAYFLKRKDVRR